MESAIFARRLLRRIRRAGELPRHQLHALADARHSGFVTSASRVISPTAREKLSLYWFAGTPNFGDALSPIILEWISGCSVQRVGPRVHGKVVAVGSNHTHIRSGDLVWGAGAMRDVAIRIPPTTHVLAVRGPLTAERLVGVETKVFGDPASLLPTFHPPSTKKQGIGVIPHYVDWHRIPPSDRYIKIDVTAHWKSVVDSITSCEQVISSSLHGVIVAESYGIPATWISLSDHVIGARLKFNDYYLGTGRGSREPQVWSSQLDSLLTDAPALPKSSGDRLLQVWASAGLPLSSKFR